MVFLRPFNSCGITSYFPIQKIVNPYISGLSEDWATNSQQQPIKQGKTLYKEKKNLC